MAQSMYGSICLDDLFAGYIGQDAQGNKWINLAAFAATGQNGTKRSDKNGKIYTDIFVGFHDNPEAHYNQNAFIKTSPPKEVRSVQGYKDVFIGNLKYTAQQQQQYNPNAQYAQQPQYQQPAQNWGGQPNAGPGGFVQPGQWAQQPSAPQPAPQNYPAPQPPQQGYPQGPAATQQYAQTQQPQYQQPPAAQPPQNYPPAPQAPQGVPPTNQQYGPPPTQPLTQQHIQNTLQNTPAGQAPAWTPVGDASLKF